MISNKDNNKNPTLETGQTITLAGHSGGGLRNYLALANSNPNQYLNSSGESVLQIQFSGTPVNNQDLILASQLAGAYFVASQNKVPDNKSILADPVGLVLGGNGNVANVFMSGLSSIFLFGKNSPHSNYGCAFSNCSPISKEEKESAIQNYKIKNSPINP